MSHHVPSTPQSLPTLITLLLASSLLGGCASANNRTSGFLGNYDNLQTNPKNLRSRVYERPDWKKANYNTVLIEPTAVHLSARDQKKLTSHETAKLATYSERALRKAFAENSRVVEAAEPGTLRVRSAITGVDTSSPVLNVVTGVILWPLDNGGVSLEYDVVDAQSAQRVAVLVGFSNGTPIQVISSFARFGHAHAESTIGVVNCANSFIKSRQNPPQSKACARLAARDLAPGSGRFALSVMPKRPLS